MSCGEKRKELCFIIFQCLIILIGYIFLCNRIRFGIDFTDESWYVAEPYIVANGAIPYVNNWTQAPGFTLPLALLFKLYIMVTGGTEGIVLYSRILYAVVSFIVYSVSVFIITKKINQPGAFIVIWPLLFHPVSLYDLTYNTLGVIYLLIGCILLFFSEADDAERKKEVIVLVISGIIIARAIIASPSVLVAWIGILIILAFTKKWSQLLWFIVGNTVAAAAVIGWCCIRGGVSGFLNGMRVLLTETVYFQIEPFHTVQDDINYVFNYCKPLLYTFIVLAALKILREKGDEFFSDQQWYRKAVIISCMTCLLLGIARGFLSGHYEHLIRYGWFEAVLIATFMKETDKDKKVIFQRFAWISGLYFAVYLFTSATNIYGFGSREYWLIIPTVLGYLSWCFVLNTKQAVAAIVFSTNLLLGFLLIKQNYGYVYRDQPIENLTTRVDYGIWKGCYTTPERAENVKLLEQYIRSVTDEEDNILFMDWVSFAYLMAEGTACVSSVMDPLLFSYQVDAPEVMYEYFESVGKTPNKIIYIDFGRDQTLSIDSDWKFNEFVNANYELVETYDTNPKIANKYAAGEVNTASFYVKFYGKKVKDY